MHMMNAGPGNRKVMSSNHRSEIQEGKRFAFGRNWTLFLEILDDERIKRAEQSLCGMLDLDGLKGKRFLDIGSGSGLFSLAARKLGAEVYSFDYDPQSAACTEELKKKYFPGDHSWKIEQGSALDREYIEKLGEWDIVYSWGVLHHTGDMWQALDNVSFSVREKGLLFIAIYNNQGFRSSLWLKIKQLYNFFPRPIRWMVLWPAIIRIWGPTTIRDIAKGKPFHTWRNYSKDGSRGMSPRHDVVDWVGGLPFEVATTERIISFYEERGFTLEKLKTCNGGYGCNEFLFRKERRT